MLFPLIISLHKNLIQTVISIWADKLNLLISKKIERNQYDYANYWKYSSCMTHERTFDFYEDY